MVDYVRSGEGFKIFISKDWLMTKKKSKKGEDELFELKKPKSTPQTPTVPTIAKNRPPTRIQKDKKQPSHMNVPVLNKMGMEDRKAYQQKYRQNLVSKRIEQEKRGFRPMRYDMEANSQMGDIDEDSVERRNDNQTIRRIKEMLEEEEMIANKQRLVINAKNQQAKVEKLSQIVYGGQSEFRELMERVKPSLEGLKAEGFSEKSCSKQEEPAETGAKTALERLADLEQIYY